MGAIGNFKFGLQVNDSKSQPADDTLSWKGHGQGQVTHFRMLHPLKYLCNGYS